MKESKITICGHGYGNPSLKTLSEYNEYRHSQDRGIVCVRRFKALDKSLTKRLAFVRKYKTILGRNIYNQNFRECVYKPLNGKYYSDCSSSGMATLVEIGFKLPWLFNTAAIMTNDLFMDVPVKIVNGHITNSEVLKYGDCLMYKGSDPSRPKGVGHVEYIFKK